MITDDRFVVAHIQVIRNSVYDPHMSLRVLWFGLTSRRVKVHSLPKFSLVVTMRFTLLHTTSWHTWLSQYLFKCGTFFIQQLQNFFSISNLVLYFVLFLLLFGDIAEKKFVMISPHEYAKFSNLHLHQLLLSSSQVNQIHVPYPLNGSLILVIIWQVILICSLFFSRIPLLLLLL